ncbi:MAG TPA: aminotransferase class I/II-fold pyridoxal phosphate-dependent enzyme [Pirellulales bacterium]|jgi:cystathionine beta-lyase/cystathionine gamma-synthase|nr:aminotransferase class I/II-fold pyridoxal phosphate-dependent enzyme [Pirellulales bacterium]
MPSKPRPGDSDDICPRPLPPAPQSTEPASPPIFMASVYRCASPDQANELLSGEAAGYVYSRDGHPNADQLAQKCRELHAAERATVCSSGMASLALAAVSHLDQASHVVVSNQLYGRTGQLFAHELPRFGVQVSVVDTCNLAATAAALRSNTRLVVCETITNPLLRVCDIAALAAIVHARQALLLVDNTLATPVVCRPLALGADLVVESLTKLMSGHSDVLLGLLGGTDRAWRRVAPAQSTWGWSPSPFDCWLALRGLGTLALRADRAIDNALVAARWLREQAKVERVDYPGLADHPDHALATQQFDGRYGNMVTLTLRGGLPAAERFIAAAAAIPFCPSLGDLSTTLSHPASTSHRSLSPEARQELGISEATIRLSIGIESAGAVVAALEQGLAGV